MFRRLKESEVDLVLTTIGYSCHLCFDFFVDGDNKLFHVCDLPTTCKYLAPLNDSLFFCESCTFVEVPPVITLAWKFNEIDISFFNEIDISFCYKYDKNYRKALRECKELDIKVPIEDN